MKKLLLSLVASISFLALQAQGTDDFATLAYHATYTADTTAAGWITTQAAVFTGGESDNTNSGIYTFFGSDESMKAVCINGRTSRIGTITSPVLQNGCGTLSLNYACLFNESNGVSFHIDIRQNGAVMKSFDVINADAAKMTAYGYRAEVGVAGDFQIYITNNCPTQSASSNKDRYSIWGISWTACDGSDTPAEVVTVPTITPASGTYTEAQTVTISADRGCAVYYTLDGSTPNDAVGTLYTEPFTLSASAVVKAIAYNDDDQCSDVATSIIYIQHSIANTPETAYTTAEAIALVDDPSSFLTDTVYVKGIVSKIQSYNSTYKSLTYWLDDNSFEVYAGYGLNRDSIPSDTYLGVGDTVIVCGLIKKYNTTYEVDKNNYLVYIGKAPEPAVSIKNTPETAYTVAEANAIITAGEDLDTKVYVKGTIVSIKEISTSYGNATYFISDDVTTANQLEVYRGYSIGGAKFTSESEIKVGDAVIVYGKLVDYNGTYEFTTGSQLYSVNGSTQAIRKVEADTTSGIDLSTAVIYNICGKRVTDMSKKGIYIVNGKKFIVK